MTNTGRLGYQRRTDHADLITSAQQGVGADQHVRDRAHATP